jgi:hypothetical protein
MCINLVKIYYVHARDRYIYLAMILRPDHVCGLQWSRVCRKSRFIEHSIGRRQHAGALAPERRLSYPPASPSPRQDNMDRASQVLAQGVPPGVP